MIIRDDEEDERILWDIVSEWMEDETLGVIDFMNRCEVCSLDGDKLYRIYNA